MRKAIKRAALTAMLVAVPSVALAVGGMVGDCYDCHTMHNSEQNAPVAQVGGSTSATPIENLLKYDCISCHANDPTGGAATMTLGGGSVVPQVMHGGADDLAGGNWRYMLDSASNRKGHNVIDLKGFYGGLEEVYPSIGTNDPLYSPPGLTGLGAHSSNRHAFTSDGGAPFDMLTCAGARGCHGTRAQTMEGATADYDGNTATPNTWEGDRRTGIAAITGAHHESYDGAKDATNIARTDDAGQIHDGAKVAEGYRFIVGLKGFGNTTSGDRWENVDENSHNEYYGVANGLNNTGTSSCHRCHIEGHMGGLNSRAAQNSTLVVPNNSMSGFCASCHGGFHSSGGAGTDSDATNNGVSGAFLRHPSDYVIPNSGEYAGYTTYDVSAPVARPTLASAVDSSVNPGTDMVMCLSCHKAHGSANDYILNFDYTAMTSGGYATIGDATAEGGCLACHTTKGVLPEDRP